MPRRARIKIHEVPLAQIPDVLREARLKDQARAVGNLRRLVFIDGRELHPEDFLGPLLLIETRKPDFRPARRRKELVLLIYGKRDAIRARNLRQGIQANRRPHRVLPEPEYAMP